MGMKGLRLNGQTDIRWHEKKAPAGFDPQSVVFGSDASGMALQVAVGAWTPPGAPGRQALKSVHARRQKGIFPLVVVATRGTTAWLLGPSQDAQVVSMPISQAERMLQAALDEPSGIAARHRLGALHRAIESGQQAGVANRGLFASHFLQTSVTQRPDWEDAKAGAGKLLALRHEDLIKALGFASVPAGEALLLKAIEAPRAVAVLLESTEQFDASSPRFDISPVAFGLRVAAKHEVPWLVVLRGTQIRLYPAKPGVGVGQRGQADTWFEIDLAVVDSAQSALLPLVFSADALAPGGSTQQLLDGSTQFAVDLGERLRARVYDIVIPGLSQAVAAQLPTMGLATDPDGLATAYRLTMKILFRLLFQAYAEDRGLLPYGRNSHYDDHSLKERAQSMVEDPGQEYDPGSTSIWDDLTTVWRVIDVGDAGWSVPAYNGGLFGSDPDLHPEGHLLTLIHLDNRTMGTVLEGLLVDEMEDGGRGSVDFRSLSVREFGTIYEGLLESALSIAPSDLALDKDERYVPAKAGDDVKVRQGEVYFHSSSGKRKSTGTYFTPHIVVEHLLVQALDPVLDDHLGKVKAELDAGHEARAHDLFFDFRVADLAMGSAHFLTAAIDHIEAKMRDFLTDNPIPAVSNELNSLELAARTALGADVAAIADIDSAGLLRRQIARRCIYGLDLNPMAVDLARLAIWITTFVPGLPMSSLDHTLVCANSLTGVGTIDEALGVLDPDVGIGQISLFSEAIDTELASARELLVDAANASEATKAEATAAAQTAIEARDAAEPARLLFDAVVAARLELLTPTAYSDPHDLQSAAADPGIQMSVSAVQPAHFPYLFPEVFLRRNAGFDVILGNPPWEKLKVEEHSWWAVRFPGLRSMTQKEKNAAIAQHRKARPDLVAALDTELAAAKATARLVSAGPYPGIGATDIDLMAAFSWRFVHELRSGGRIGVVLPRTALAGSACEQWRRTLMKGGDIADLTMITNTARWAFDMEPRYTVALLAYHARPGQDHQVALQGPYASRDEFLSGTAQARSTSVFPAEEVEGWTATAAVPLLPDARSLPVFAQMRKYPDFNAAGSGWHFRPYRELDATKEKNFFDFDLDHPAANHTLPVWTGRTFNLWAPGSGPPYAFANPSALVAHLQEKRRTSARRAESAFTGLAAQDLDTPESLPMFKPRIAFRDVARATDSRTMVCCLVPPGVVLVHKAPFLVRQFGSEQDEAYALGVLSSIPFDWYARRFVEITMSFALLGAMPVPRPSAGNLLRHRVVHLAGRLAAVDERYADWAEEIGVPTGSVTSDAERADLLAELDALVSLLYGLRPDQVEHIFATFHRGWDFKPRLIAVLKHYDTWEAKA